MKLSLIKKGEAKTINQIKICSKNKTGLRINKKNFQ